MYTHTHEHTAQPILALMQTHIHTNTHTHIHTIMSHWMLLCNHTYTHTHSVYVHAGMHMWFYGFTVYGFTDLGCSAPSVHPLVVSTSWREGRQLNKHFNTKRGTTRQKLKQPGTNKKTKQNGRAHVFRLVWSTPTCL